MGGSYIPTIHMAYNISTLYTVYFQAEQLSPGDFVKEWIQLKRQMTRQEGSIAKEMLSSMMKREEVRIKIEYWYISCLYFCLGYIK